MPDELSYAETAGSATQAATALGLSVDCEERDETLYARITRPGGLLGVVGFSTRGTGVFLVDFDDGCWGWQVTAYDRADQLDAVAQIVRVARAYLHGEGRERVEKRRLRPSRTTLVLTVDDERIVLRRAGAGRPSPPPQR